MGAFFGGFIGATIFGIGTVLIILIGMNKQMNKAKKILLVIGITILAIIIDIIILNYFNFI
jgi:multisubunit Na+/H+ antiporter MnhB subunit